MTSLSASRLVSLVVLISAGVSSLPSIAAAVPNAEPPQPTALAQDTVFEPVRTGGGGFVTGMSFSEDGATRVIRTDGFGGYRWADNEWQLAVSSDSLPAEDVAPGLGGGVLAVAVAPSDSDRVYMAFADALYRSDDGARHWVRILSDVTTAANDDFRTTGSRLVVDPTNPNVVYYGTQVDGLRVSDDGGASWNRGPVGLPSGLLVDLADTDARGDLRRPTTSVDGAAFAGAGINAIVVDPSGPVREGRSQRVFAAVFGAGVYESADAGASWSRISPVDVAAVGSMRVLGNGDLVLTARQDPTRVSGNARVWRYRGGSWTDITPSRAGNWHALAGDPGGGGTLVAMAPGGRLAVSGDHGTTWRLPTRTQSSVGDVPWLSWALNEGSNWMSVAEIAFDPVVPGRLWLAEGTGVWFANVTAETASVAWRSQSRGIEQLVSTGIVKPPGGRPVMTAWDRAIFASEDVTKYPTHYGPVNRFGSGWSVDWSITDPSYLVASVASHQYPYDPSSSGFSTDGGRTWTPFPTIPVDSKNSVSTFGFGVMAVSTPGNVVWVPSYGKRPYFTLDGGHTWQPVVLPGVTNYGLVNNKPHYVNRRILAADRTNPNVFYLYVGTIGTFRTEDGGVTWHKMSDTSGTKKWEWEWNATLKSVPGSPGELFFTPGRLAHTTSQPFLHSADGGGHWAPVAGVTGVTAFGFGRAAPGRLAATIFIAGWVRGRYGIYRSVDNGTTWAYLIDYPMGRTPIVEAIDGDLDEFGALYMAIAGSSWAVGKLRPTGSVDPVDPVDPPVVTPPRLRANVQVRAAVSSGVTFRARVRTNAPPHATVRWVARGCRVKSPRGRSTTLRCYSKRGTVRRVVRVVIIHGKNSARASSSVRITARSRAGR